MSKVDLSFSNNEARALEREAKAAKANMEQLVHELASVPADALSTVLARIDSDRKRLEVIAARAEQALEGQRVELAAKLARLDRRLEGQVAELERRRIEASKAEAEAAHQADRYALERARDDAREGLDLFAESLARQSRA